MYSQILRELTFVFRHILPESALEEKEPLSKADFDSRLAVGIQYLFMPMVVEEQGDDISL